MPVLRCSDTISLLQLCYYDSDNEVLNWIERHLLLINDLDENKSAYLASGCC